MTPLCRNLGTNRLLRGGIGFFIILAGLVLRGTGPQLGLPFEVTKYGGSVLWGAMVYFLAAVLARRASSATLLVPSLLIAIAVEIFRLVHAPWLDAFRVTTAGGLLLGRVFSVWNLLAYAVGIGLAALLDLALRCRRM